MGYCIYCFWSFIHLCTDVPLWQCNCCILHTVTLTAKSPICICFLLQNCQAALYIVRNYIIFIIPITKPLIILSTTKFCTIKIIPHQQQQLNINADKSWILRLSSLPYISWEQKCPFQVANQVLGTSAQQRTQIRGCVHLFETSHYQIFQICFLNIFNLASGDQKCQHPFTPPTALLINMNFLFSIIKNQKTG